MEIRKWDQRTDGRTRVGAGDACKYFLYILVGSEGDHQQNIVIIIIIINNIFRWGLMALTTVGNGDKAPSTHVGKVKEDHQHHHRHHHHQHHRNPSYQLTLICNVLRAHNLCIPPLHHTASLNDEPAFHTFPKCQREHGSMVPWAT